MDFKQLTECFGGTIFADDYRTNLSAASECIVALKAEMSDSSHQNDKSGLLLAQAVYYSICGDFASADDFLNQLSRVARSTNDSSLLARCNLYEVYFRCIRDNPPFLRFRVDSDTGPGIIRGLGKSALRVRYLRKPVESGHQRASSLEKLEARTLRQCAGYLNDLWLEALPEDPRYFKELPITLFRQDKDYLDILQQSGEDADFPAIVSYLNKMTLQYLLAGDAKNARNSVGPVYEDALERGNPVAAANHKLQLADAIISPPFTSPFALNLISTVGEVGWTNSRWDGKEQQFHLERDPEAMQYYQQARFLFEAGGSRRGMASVLLRFGCLDLAEAMLEPVQEDTEIVRALVKSAYDHLMTAIEWFEEDVTNSLIVKGHLAICNIIRKDFSEALRICFDIGETGSRKGNTCTSEFIGMLLLRLARRLVSRKIRLEHVPWLCACAKVCFTGLSDPYLELHAITASAKFYQTIGNIPVATKHVDEGRRLLRSVQTYFDSLKAQVESLRSFHEDEEQRWLDHDLQMLHGKLIGCTSSYDHVVSEVDNSIQNRSSTLETTASPPDCTAVDSSIQNRSSTPEMTSSPVRSEQPASVSSTVAMLQWLQSSGLDPSLMAGFQTLLSGATSIDQLRQEYQNAVKRRRDSLVNEFDIDDANTSMRNVLEKLEESSIFSEELDAMKTAACQYLGEFTKARNIITRVLPRSFGGTRNPLPEIEDAGQEIQAMTKKSERMKFDRAVSLCFAAKDWQRGMLGVQDMLQRDLANLDDMRSSDDPHIWYNMVWLAAILEKHGDLSRAFEWYLGAFDVVETRRQQLADIADRRDILATITSGELFLGMARIAFRFSQTSNDPCGPTEEWTLTSGQWKDQILRFLELGRSRTILDILIAGKINPQKLKTWTEYSHPSNRKEVNSSRDNRITNQPIDRVSNVSESRDEYLKRIEDETKAQQDLESLSSLSSNPAAIRESNENLYQCIPKDAIVLHISSGREGLMILCITSEGVINVYTAETTNLEMDRHIFRLAKLFHNVENLDSSSLPNITACEESLQEVSSEIIEPVAQFIRTKEHIIFAPSPSLNKFPLCALFYEKKPLFLSKDVSQIPSLSVLQHLVDGERHVNKNVNVIYKDPTLGSDLYISTAAAINIVRHFCTDTQATAGTPTLANFIQMYQQSDVLLIATHGTTGTKSAWESQLLLDPPVRVLDLVQLQSRASLVIFEACVSGRGEESIGNDLLGFSHAVLASGTSAFLGGLWKLSDEASALLMLFLFEEFKTNDGSKSLARCWRNAQIRLYKSDAAATMAIFENLKRQCLLAFTAKLIDKKLAGQLRRTLGNVIDGIKRFGADFKHPFYWAPFVLMGNAGIVLELAA